MSTPINYGENDMAEAIASYVKLISGSNSSVWEILYYCFRCGDANAAKAVLDATPAGGRDDFSEKPIINRVVSLIKQRQGYECCIFEAGTSVISSEARLTIFDLFEKTKNLAPNDEHKQKVLALFSGERMESSNTIEDYLFGCLWTAVMNDENPVEQIKVVGNSIRKYGPSHFAEDGSGEWGYVLPLLASQQFRTALSYLAEAGGSKGLMQAVHLAKVFDFSGVHVVDLDNTLMANTASMSQDIITSLIAHYTILLGREPTVRASVSLQYLLEIPNKRQRINEVANLICRLSSEDMETLTGVLDDVGNRKNSILDQFLPDVDASAILVTAADLCKQQTHLYQTSAKLYMLAKSHVKILHLLNDNICPVDVQDANRELWTKQSELFHQTFLSRRSIVIDTLEMEGKMCLIETNRKLLALRSFFDMYRKKQFAFAFSNFLETGLFPSNQANIDEKARSYQDLDPILKQQFPNALCAGVACVCYIFNGLKAESRGIPSAVEQRLSELHTAARYLFVFAGMINMPSTCKNDIQRMNAGMIA